jgi:hypothetical protein
VTPLLTALPTAAGVEIVIAPALPDTSAPAADTPAAKAQLKMILRMHASLRMSSL